MTTATNNAVTERTTAGGRCRTRTRRVALTIAVLLAGGGAALPRIPLVLYNRTPSMPIGVYVRVGHAPGRGDVVAFHLPVTAWDYARARGEPTDIVLLKHVLAAGGDDVDTRAGRLVVNGLDIGPIPTVDSAGRPLPQWPADRVLAADELLPGSTLPCSFDGRFFGPIRLADVLGVYRPLGIGSASIDVNGNATIGNRIPSEMPVKQHGEAPCPRGTSAREEPSDHKFPTCEGEGMNGGAPEERLEGKESDQCRAR